MLRNVKLIMIVLLLLSSLVGCNGKVDISDLGLVMAVGIDKGKKEGTVKVTTQIAVPANVMGATGTPAAGGQGEPIWTASAEGESIFEAIRNLGRFSSRRIYWAHNHVIVINEDYARDVGITDVIDFFTRNNQLRLKTWVVATPKAASEVVSTKTGLEVVPGRSVEKLFLYNQIIAEAPSTNMIQLASSYMSESTHPVLAKLDIKDRGISTEIPGEFGSTPQVEMSGTAVFEKDKFKGWLTPTESRGLLWFIQKVESVVIPLSCPENEKKPASVEIKDYNFEAMPMYKDGKVSFDIKLKVYGEMVELGFATPLENPEIEERLQKALEDKLKEEIESVIKKTQKKYKVDVLKLGERVENRYPGEWKYDLRSRWKEVYPTVKTNITVEAKILSPSLLENPTRPVKD